MRRDLHISERHVITSHTRKKLFFVNFGALTLGWLPILKLPLVSTAENADHPTPLSVRESLGAVINIEYDLSLIYQPFDLDWRVSVG